jgi:hypothetical protein
VEFTVFTVEEAKKYADDGQLSKWLIQYLTECGQNSDLAQGIQLQKEAVLLTGPNQYPLWKMERCSGPEEGIQFPESTERWEKRVEMAVRRLRGGLNPPPLVITPKDTYGASISTMVQNSRYVVLAGNPQYEALKRMERTEYWAINCVGLRLS